MNNTIRITLIVILSFLLVFFCYKLYLNLTLIEKSGYYDFERANIKEEIVGDKKIITEKNLGVKMEIPKDWGYEKYYNGINFIDPNINVEYVLQDFRDWASGCLITYYVNKGEENYNQDFNRLVTVKEGDKDFCPRGNDCEIVSINGVEGLKSIKKFEDLKDFDGTLENVYITLLDSENNRVHIIETFISSQVPECQEHLNNFINSLEFK